MFTRTLASADFSAGAIAWSIAGKEILGDPVSSPVDSRTFPGGLSDCRMLLRVAVIHKEDDLAEPWRPFTNSFSKR